MARYSKLRLPVFIVMAQVCLLYGSFAEAKKTNIQEDLSKWLRSRVEHFWLGNEILEEKFFATQELNAFVAERIERASQAQSTSSLLSYQGWLHGDPHMGNFGFVFQDDKMHFLNIDFDDAGYGPFALDFARFAVMVQSVTQKADLKRLTNVYMEGLRRGVQGIQNSEDIRNFIVESGNNGTVQIPKELKAIINWGRSDFEYLVDKYAQGKTKILGGKIVMKDNELFELPESDHSEVIASLSSVIQSDDVVLDVQKRIAKENVSGDDPEPRRFWILVKKSNGKLRIYEMKEILESSIVDFEKRSAQKRNIPYRAIEPSERFARTREVYWLKNTNSDEYGIATYRNSRFYYRVKFGSPIDVPYTTKKPAEIEYIHNVADMDALYMGVIHGMQSGSDAYLELIEKNTNNYVKELYRLTQSYLKRARGEMKP